jgi:hypothetical protein
MRIHSTGRTFKQLRDLPDGSLFVAGHAPMAQYAKMLLGKHFPGKQVKIISVDSMLSRNWAGMLLTGLDIDHAVYLDEPREVMMRQLLKSRVRRVVLTTGEAAMLKEYLSGKPAGEVFPLASIWEKIK